LKDDSPWFVGYSGGKDSSAVLTLVFNALLEIQRKHKPVGVVYCDTGVEIPPISRYVTRTLKAIQRESRAVGIPLRVTVAKPRLDDRYFVKVIGRGYPPPTNIFRWCTDRLRINPVKNIIEANGRCGRSIVLLGVRLGESIERDRTIRRHNTKAKYYLNQGGSTTTQIFSPIIDYSVIDVWSTLKYSQLPKSISHSTIGQLYKDAGSECPVFKETKGTPCGKGRFGCWTCTVVRRDVSVGSMIQNGYEELSPLFAFRNWLAEFRDQPEFRCKTRRNGTAGLGPITLAGRKKILRRLVKTEIQSGLTLLEKDELVRIKGMWLLDQNDPHYCE
jgi:DNA sulfur modification protein DndC